METPNMEAGIKIRDAIPPRTHDATLGAANEEGIISVADEKKYLSPLQKMSLGLLGLKVESLSDRMVRKDLYKTATGAVDSPEYIDMVLANLHQERARSLAFFDTVDRVSHASVERMRNLLFPVKKGKTAKKRYFGKTLVAVRHTESSIVPKEYDLAVILPSADWKQKMWEESSQRRIAEGKRLSQERAATEAWYDELIQGWNNDRAVAVANRKIFAEAALLDQERRAVELKEPTTWKGRLGAANRQWTNDSARGETKVDQDNRAVEPKLPYTINARLAAFDWLGTTDVAGGPRKANKEEGWVESKAPSASDAGLMEHDEPLASDPLLARLWIRATRLILKEKNFASPAQIEIVKGGVQAQRFNLMEDFKADIKRALEMGTHCPPGGKKSLINVTVLDLSQGTEKVEEADVYSTRHIERLEKHVALKADRVALAGPDLAASDKPLRGGAPTAEEEALQQYAHFFSDTDEVPASNNWGLVHETERHLTAEKEEFLEQNPHSLEGEQALSGSNWDPHEPQQHLLATHTEMGSLWEQHDAMCGKNLASHLIDGYTAQSTSSKMPMAYGGTTASGRTNGNKAIYQGFSQDFSHPTSVDLEDETVPPHPLCLSIHDLQDPEPTFSDNFMFFQGHCHGILAGMDVWESDESDSSSIQLAMREKKLNAEYDDKGWGYINSDGYIANGIGMSQSEPPRHPPHYRSPNPLAPAVSKMQVNVRNALANGLHQGEGSLVMQEPEDLALSDTSSCISCKCEDGNYDCDFTSDTSCLHTSAFIRNIRRCAKFVDDVVRYDHVWLSHHLQDEHYENTSSSSECSECSGLQCDDDCRKCRSGTGSDSLKISKLARRRLGDILAAEFKLQLEKRLITDVNMAHWEAKAAQVGGRTFDFNYLLHTSLPESRRSSDVEEYAYFLRTWNVRAMTMGWLHTQYNKGLQLPRSVLPAYLHTVRLAPPIQEKVEQEVLPNWRLDKWRVGRCLVYLEDPYDTVDWRIREADMSQKRRRDQDIQQMVGWAPLETDTWLDPPEHDRKRPKRMEPTPPVSAQELRGGCLDEDGSAEPMPLPALRKRRRTLLASDPMYYSTKRKYTNERPPISSAPPQTVPPPQSKMQKTDTTPRYVQRSFSPVPDPPPSPPGTPPNRHATVTAGRSHWLLPAESQLGRQCTNKRPNTITLNLDHPSRPSQKWRFGEVL